MSTINDISDNGRTLRKQATRAAIVAGARALFLANGYEATTTRDIARTCGVAVGTVFAHFPDKEHLLHDILSTGIKRALAEARSTISDRSGGCDALLAYARKLIPFYLDTPELSRTLLRSTMFDGAAYRHQAEAFVAEIAGRLVHDVPSLAAEDRRVAAEVLFAAYLSVVVEALGDDASSAEAALARLEVRCGLFLAPYQVMR